MAGRASGGLLDGVISWREEDLERLRLVASAMAGRSVALEPAEEGASGYTDGRVVYLPAVAERNDVLAFLAVQGSLLAAGSLDPALMARMTGRAGVARRYLAVEGWRALAEMADRLPRLPIVEAALRVDHPSSSPEQSVELALGRRPLPDPPPVFGMIRPRMIRAAAEAVSAAAPTARDLVGDRPPDVLPEVDDDEAEDTIPLGSLSRLFNGGLQTGLSRWLTKKLGGRGQPEDGDGGSDLPMGGSRAASQVGANAQVCLFPVTLTPTEVDTGRGRGWCYPEWDTHARRYRTDWCTVTEFDPAVGDPAALSRPYSADLKRRLARLAVALERHRRRPQGDDIDLDAAVDARIVARSGLTPPEEVYLETQRTRRSLSVLILVDVSGSSAERTATAGDVLRHERQAAALLADALASLGDRVAVFGFRSRGRQSVSLLRVKDFDDQLTGAAYGRLAGLAPAGYTRLGAAVRHGAHILDRRGGTARRLLIVLSDGFPYDDGYEGRYAEADARRSLAEARRNGIGCLCLSLGATNDDETLSRVFGTAAHAAAPQFDDLIPDIGRLFRRAIASADLQRRLAQRQRRSEPIDTRGAA
jgi:Mg-chelatase subunit ChlD